MPLSLDPDRERPAKRLGGFLGLLDTPLFRDWLAWWSAFWVLVGVLSVIFPSANYEPTTRLPVWLNAALSAVVLGLIMGVLPAYVRVLVRRRLIIRRRRMEGTQSAAEQGAQLPATAPKREDAPELAGSRPVVKDPPTPARSLPTQARPTMPVLQVPDLQSDPVLVKAASNLPYPIARATRRLQLAAEPKDQYEAALRTGESLAIVLGLTAVAWAVQRDVRTPQVEAFVQALLGRGVPQGLFADAAASVERQMNGDDGMPGFAAAMRRSKGQPGLHNDLKTITEERNRWAHGASPRSPQEAQQRLLDVLPPLSRALESADGLSQHEWLLVSDSSFERHHRNFRLTASRAMGDHPDWDRTYLESDVPVAEDSLYVVTPSGLLDLTPLCVVRPCPECGQSEVAYADRLHASQGVSLKSFDSGHTIFDLGLVRDVKGLAPPTDRGESGS